MLGSFLTGLGTSVLTGQDSVLTGAGVCAPAPELFIKDGASFLTGKASVLTAATPPACNTAPSCDTGTVAFGPTLFAETDIATNPPSALLQLARSIQLDGTAICGDTAPGGKLSFDILSGEINYDEVGGVTILIGANPTNPLEGTVVYTSVTNPTGALWIDILLRPNEGTNTFNNPNPAGPIYLKITATPGAGALAGIRNWTGKITVN